ncbi:MAG TPA: ATP-binding cassette domain-containing protein [Gemmatimonadaceae bacterium]
MGPILELEGITKRFGSTTALDGASFSVRAGTVHALLGENGAGKTTLMRIAFGLVRPDAGVMRVRGRTVHVRAPRDAIALGLGMVHQHFTLVPAMTVAEHLALVRRGRYRPRDAVQLARELGERVGLVLDPSQRAADLGVAGQQRLEILKALAAGGEVLILDEPTAVLAPQESEELLDWVRQHRARGGSVVLITHKLHEALAVADDVTVLRHGRVTLTGPRAELAREQIVAAMLGGLVSETAPAMPSAAGGAREAVVTAVGLELRDPLSGVARIRDATFHVDAGEIVGVAAVEGSGHRALLRALAGRLRPATGTLLLPPSVGFIPEDRHRDALVLSMDLVENVALRGLSERRGRMPWDALASEVNQLVAEYSIRTAGVRMPVAALSGGNQQKLVLARELAGNPALVVAEDPTRGLDVQATAAVLARLRSARAAGAALVVHSSDLDEVLAIADRVLVVYAGTVREVPPDRAVVGRAMLGAA